MKVSEKYFDQIFEYRGEWDLLSKCGLRIVETASKTYVIVTELYQDNPGSSVTTVAFSLCNQICEAFSLDKSRVEYVECAPSTNSKLSFYDSQFYRVTFNGTQPVYHQIEDLQLEINS